MLCLMKISLVTMCVHCAQQPSKLPWSVQQTGFALTWKKSPPVSVVNWAFTSCKLCTEGLTAPDAISSSAQRSLPLTAKSQRPSLSECHHLSPPRKPARSSGIQHRPRGQLWRAGCPSYRHMVKAAWSCFQEGIKGTSKFSGVGLWWS